MENERLALTNDDIRLNIMSTEKFNRLFVETPAILADKGLGIVSSGHPDMPKKEFLDLTVYYQYDFGHPIGKGENTRSNITESDVIRKNLDVNALFDIALENEKRISPARTIRVDDEFFILTNKDKNVGTPIAFFGGELKNISEKIGGNFYILPSSIHELICIGTEGHSVKELREIVKGANTTVVLEPDILSYSVYLYNADTDSVEIAK